MRRMTGGLVLALLAATGGQGWAQEGEETTAGGPAIEVPAGVDPSRDAAGQRVERAGPTSLGGYGEIVFEDFEDGDNEIDFHRFVVFVAHRFNDWIRFYSEVEVEHAHEVEMEQARLDFRVTEELTLTAGLVLVPVGLTNLYHEPSFFHGVNRPRVDQVILPTTWREAGVGLTYRPVDWLSVEAYAMSALSASGFSAASGIRGGRLELDEALANDFAGALRVTVEPVLGLAVALSGYYGGADQDALDGVDVTVQIAALDAWYRNLGLEVRGQLATVFVSDTEPLSAALGETIGEMLLGWYVEVAYDVLHTLATEHQLLPFARYERFDTQASVADGLAESDDLDRTDVTLGLTYRPIAQVVFKFDYQLTSSAGDAEVPDQWDLGLGWMF